MLRLSITLPNNAQINLESEDEVVIDRVLGIVLTDISHALLAGLTAPEASAGVSPVPGAARPVPAVSVEPVVTVETTPQHRVLEDQGPSPSTPAPTVPAPENPPSATSEPATSSPVPSTLEPEAPGQGTVHQPEPVSAQPGEESHQDDSAPQQAPAPLLSDWDVSLREQPEEAWPQLEGSANGMEASNGSGQARNLNPTVSSVVPEVAERAFVDFCRAANPLGDMRRVVVAAEGANRYLSMDGVDAEALGRLFDTVGWPRAHNFVQTLRNAARSKFGWLERIPGRAGHYTVTDVGRSTALGR